MAVPASPQDVLDSLERHFGKGIRRAWRRPGPRHSLRCLPTGCLLLDRLIGGLPRGIITEIFGPEGTGKSTLALAWIAQAQRAGAMAACVDANHTLPPLHARTLGVDLDRLLVNRPTTGEEALTVAETLIASGAVDLVVVDSVAALATRREIEERLTISSGDLHGRLLLQAIHRLPQCLSRTSAVLVLINQTRARMGIPIGPAERTVAEQILTAATAVRIHVEKDLRISNGPHIVGHHLVLRVLRNPLGVRVPPVVMALDYGPGFTRARAVVTHDVAHTHVTEEEFRHAAR